jgi:glycerol-3-phosphate dehydrogenase
MTADPVMTHRSAGTEMAELVQDRLKPSGSKRPVDYAARKFPANQNSPPVVDDWTDAKLADLVYAAKHEHATSLVDLMFRRVGAGWTKTMGYAAADKAADTVASVYGWDADRVKIEADNYRRYLDSMHQARHN